MPRNAAVCCLLGALAACGDGATPTQPSPPPQSTYSVQGTVRDSGNQNLLAESTVQITASTTFTAVTGFTGEFSFPQVSGAATVMVSAAGYAPATIPVTGAAILDVRLQRVAGRSVTCGDRPDTGNRILPIFSSPFDGVVPLTNYFDHDLPILTASGNGYQLTACDERVAGRIDGHQGYDWLLPTGTAVLATADGEVTGAGVDPPFFCAPLGRPVSDQQFVEVRHPAVNGVQFSSVYVHLSRIDVRIGQTVGRGQVVGLSGNTGCSTEPHLHLQVWRFTQTNSGGPVLVDPYGWEGAGLDPWSDHASGSGSIWLWQPGQAPALRPR